MVYVSDDPNLTEKRYNTVYRNGDITGESADNVTTDIKKKRLSWLPYLKESPFQQIRKGLKII